MFAFHKPKIYRSVNGCCICKAKSSSSRFTDSKKYEPEFERCFRINERRSGEICNACVLLVKRWKKLPAGTNRDWHHVVDVREKSVNKKPKAKTRAIKKRVSKKLKTKVIVDNIRDQLRHHLRTTSGGLSDDVTIGDDSLSECSNFSLPQSRIPSPTPTESSEDSGIQDEEDDDMDDDVSSTKKRKEKNESKTTTTSTKRSLDKRGSTETTTNRRKMSKSTRSNPMAISSFLDMTFWRKEKICCGLIFKGPNGEVLICPKLLRPCQCRLKSQTSSTNPSVVNEGIIRHAPKYATTQPLLAVESTLSFSK